MTNSDMEEPSESEVQEFLNKGENAPKTVQLTKEAQDKVLDAIRNSNVSVIVPTATAVDEKKIEIDQWCAHCDTTSHYVTNEADMTTLCKNCGKTIVLCEKCESNKTGENCDNCIYCDLANFYNYVRGKNTLEQFLSALNPSLTDMTTVSDELKDKVLTYDDFIYDTYGDAVVWDVKYWEIVGLIKNSMLNGSSPETDVISFLEDIISRNKK